jgi:hypothetical protein
MCPPFYPLYLTAPRSPLAPISTPYPPPQKAQTDTAHADPSDSYYRAKDDKRRRLRNAQRGMGQVQGRQQHVVEVVYLPDYLPSIVQ